MIEFGETQVGYTILDTDFFDAKYISSNIINYPNGIKYYKTIRDAIINKDMNSKGPLLLIKDLSEHQVSFKDKNTNETNQAKILKTIPLDEIVSCFLTDKHTNNMSKFLNIIIESEELTSDLLISIINNKSKYFSNNDFKIILNANKRAFNNDVIKTILEYNCSEVVLFNILNYSEINVENLKYIIIAADDENILKRTISCESFNLELAKFILAKTSNKETIIALINSNIANEELLTMIFNLHNYSFVEKISSNVLTSAKLLKKIQATGFFVNEIYKNQNFTKEMIEDAIIDKNNLRCISSSPYLDEELIKKIINYDESNDIYLYESLISCDSITSEIISLILSKIDLSKINGGDSLYSLCSKIVNLPQISVKDLEDIFKAIKEPYFEIINAIISKNLINEEIINQKKLEFGKMLDVYLNDKNKYSDLRITITKNNPFLTSEDIKKIYNKLNKFDGITYTIASHPNTPEYILKDIMKKYVLKQRDILLSIITNPGLNEDLFLEIIKKLKTDHEFDVALNSKFITSSVLKTIVRKVSSEFTLETIIKHPLVNDEIINMIIEETDIKLEFFILDPKVYKANSNMIRKIYDLKSRNIKYASDVYFYKKIISNPECPLDIIETIIKKYKDLELALALLENSNIDNDILNAGLDIFIPMGGDAVKDSIFKLISYHSSADSRVIGRVLKNIKSYENFKECFEKKSSELSEEEINQLISYFKSEIIDVNQNNYFEKILLIEKESINRKVQNQSENSEIPNIDFKKEYYNVLSVYLKEELKNKDRIQMKLIIIKEMYEENLLSEKISDSFYDSKYICECGKDIKLCRSMASIINSKGA